MFEKIGKAILVLILTAGVILGAYLGFTRYFIELQNRTVELCVDLNDVKKIAAYEKKPLGPVLQEIKKLGVVSIGVLEETLPDAAALGELDYSKGSGIIRLESTNPVFKDLRQRGLIKAERTYIYVPDDMVRKRVYNQLKWALGKQSIKFIGRTVMEVDEAEEEIRVLGLGISEAQGRFLDGLGFRIIPRVWNDPRYHLGNTDLKIRALENFDTIIFDGEETLGYPDALKSLAAALENHKIKYGYIEIIKQFGNRKLGKLMANNSVRVHSVSRDELKKITKTEAVQRFVRAARERNVRLIYIRPFLAPQVDAYPVAFNLDYLTKVKASLQKAGFILGKAEKVAPLEIKGWHIMLLGISVLIGALFLLNYYLRIPVLLMYLLLILAGTGMLFAGGEGYGLLMQKALALLAAITFPSLAVISSFERKVIPSFLLWDMTSLVLNIVAETAIGVFLLMGLLADSRFMLGVERFAGVKLALIVPILLVAIYFILRQGEGSFKNRIQTFLNTQIKLIAVFAGLVVLAGLGIFVARSGNFVLPIPNIEKYFRNFLEAAFFIRPRTKEFIIGYPFLFLAAVSFIRRKQKWFWVLASIGAIAPISIMNSFSHIHTPVLVSMTRTVNGLGLGIIIGLAIGLIANRFMKE